MSKGTARRAHPGGPSFSALQRVGSPARLWRPQGRSGTMNTLADCAIARHADEVSSASISLQLALTALRQARAFTRQSPYRWGEDEQLIKAAVLAVCSPVTNAVRHGAQRPSPGRRCERIRPSLITLTEVRDGSGILPVQRPAGREDDCGRALAIIDALAEYWTSGRAPGGGKWVRACMSRGNGLFDRGR